jgi:type IV pilus assembly protein PilC
LFKTHGAELPAFTRVVMDLSRYVQAYWLVIFIFIAAVIFGLYYFNKTSKKFSTVLDILILKLPVFGKLLQKVIFARVTRILAITLNAGMLIVDALYLVEDVVKNSIYATAIASIKEDVIAGQEMCVAMGATNLFPNMMVKMVEIGEKTGEMKEILHKIADYYEEEVELTVSNMSAILEPFIIIFLGGIVAVLVISMYLPIFKLGSIF